MTSTLDDERTHMETRDLIPWWVNGRLADAEARQVESHLARCAECRADVEVEQRLRAAVRHKSAVAYAPQVSLQKLLSHIEDVEREMPTRPAPGAPGTPPATAVASGTRWKVAAGVLLGLGLGLLASSGWQSTRAGGPAAYRTATSAQPATARAAQVRVVFSSTTSVEELTRIVAGNGLTIVDGPSASGVYDLALAAGSRDSAAVAVVRLRADPRVRFAEPVLSAGFPTGP